MKHLLTFFLLCTTCVIALGQENSEVTKRLKEKYNTVIFHHIYDGDGYVGWYSIVKGEYDYNHKSGNEGACDINGHEIIPPVWDDVSYFKNYFTVEKNGKQGVRDKNNNEMVPCQFDKVTSFQLNDGNFVEVTLNKKCGVYDAKEHKLVVPCQYKDVSSFMLRKGNRCMVYKNGGMTPTSARGIYDIKLQKEVLPCGKYSYVLWDDDYKNTVRVCKGLQHTSYKDGKYTVYKVSKNGKWGIYDLDKQIEIIPCKYDGLSQEQDGVFAFNIGGNVTESPSFAFEGGLWGYIDTKGNEIIPAQYSLVKDFNDGVAQVIKDGVTSFLEHPLKGTKLKLANGGSGGSKVDANIPETGRMQENTFAFIIANENYSHLKGSDFSINDGKVFKEYCHKTLGIPDKNIRYYEDATFGNITGAIQKLKDIVDVYEGDARIILYYSGLGTSDNQKGRFILPVDASIQSLNTTGYSIDKLMEELNALNTETTLVILDAPFSGADKEGSMLLEHRGVRIAPKPTTAGGNTILCISSNQTEIARSDKKYSHSLFTYALLDKLQTSKGTCTIKDAVDYATQWVKRESMSSYNATQTPQVNISEKKKSSWPQLKW